MRKPLLLYLVPAALVFASPFLPDSGHDSRDVPFMQNLGPNVLPLAFWLTVLIFLARCAIGATRRPTRARGFDVITDTPSRPPEEPPASPS
jgi:hypothetical protein